MQVILPNEYQIEYTTSRPAHPCHQIHMVDYFWQRDDYTISTERTRLDIPVIHRFLAEESYWAQGRPYEAVVRSINHSICFGLYHITGEQVGFARAITDFTTHGYLADLFVLAPHRGQGLGKWLVQCALAHPELHHLPRWLLKTVDAHGLYRRFGFTTLADPQIMMELTRA
jgi:GNAT superfamily N-acetyltransferase